jgi:sugar/nucleoside kinase (ribokinase family)
MTIQALFIGQTYIDVTFLTDRIPVGDEKSVASEYAVSFGGNAVTAAFCCAKLSIKPDLIATGADDWLGRMFMDMCNKYEVSLHIRKVTKSSLSFVMPRGFERAIVRCRDDRYLHPFPVLDLQGCRALHVDGHQADAAIHYARHCRDAGILTSLDGGAVRSNTHELLPFIDVAVVAERFCEQMQLSPAATLDYLHGRGCSVCAVTLGEKGLVWREKDGPTQFEAPVPVPLTRIVDTSGAGDVFHGAYIYSCLSHSGWSWAEHFAFAKAAAAFKIQRLGNEAGLPALADIAAIQTEFRPLAPEQTTHRDKRNFSGLG